MQPNEAKGRVWRGVSNKILLRCPKSDGSADSVFGPEKSLAPDGRIVRTEDEAACVLYRS